VKLEKGKGSRDDALKVRKMLYGGIDPDFDTNSEYLRREKLNGVEHTER